MADWLSIREVPHRSVRRRRPYLLRVYGLSGLLTCIMGLLAGLLAAELVRVGAARFSGKALPLLGQSLAEMIRDSVCSAYLPAAVYSPPGGLAEELLGQSLGWYGYLRGEEQESRNVADYIELEELQQLLEEENKASRAEEQPEDTNQSGVSEQNGQDPETEEESAAAEESDETEGDAAAASFIPHAQQAFFSDELLQDADTVLETFYTIDSNTAVSDGQIDAQRFLETDLTLEKTDGDGPQILIYHTHSQEAFADSTEGDPATTIVGVGERLAQILTETYGYRVLHHTGEYDVPDRDTAYGSALPEIRQILENNPSIEVVIDLHRDQMDEDTRLVTDIDGRPTARFMFFNGLSYTKKTGPISYLENENLEGNLAFSFQMQLTAAEYYPGLTRKIYLKGYRYNMHLRARTLLIELGAQNNTVEEAMNACEPLAHVLSMVLSGT